MSGQQALINRIEIKLYAVNNDESVRVITVYKGWGSGAIPVQTQAEPYSPESLAEEIKDIAEAAPDLPDWLKPKVPTS